MQQASDIPTQEKLRLVASVGERVAAEKAEEVFVVEVGDKFFDIDLAD
jgi:hypothetical protein